MKGQIFTIDLMIALVLLVLAIGLLTQAWDWQLQQATSTFEQAKMQQIAIDGAAVKYYFGTTGKLATSAQEMGYELYDSPQPIVDCIGSTRGDGTEVFVCRGA